MLAFPVSWSDENWTGIRYGTVCCIGETRWRVVMTRVPSFTVKPWLPYC